MDPWVVDRAPGGMSAAIFSPDRVKRYWLVRQLVEEPNRSCLFLMFNPSTADAFKLDNTVRRCLNYTKAWGYDAMMVTNLYAYRTTYPAELAAALLEGREQYVDENNDRHILSAATQAHLVVCAWGAHKLCEKKAPHILTKLQQEDLGQKLHYLRLTKKGQPSHPLRLPKNLTPTRWTTFVSTLISSNGQGSLSR